MNKFKKGSIAILFAMLCLMTVHTASAGDRVFPVGKVIPIQALMCSTSEAATIVALLKGQNNRFIRDLIVNGWCVTIRGYGQYVKQVVDEDGWVVWEVRFGDSSFYEATDWKPEGA